MGRKSREKRERRRREPATRTHGRNRPMTAGLAEFYESYRVLLIQLRRYADSMLASEGVFGCSVCGRATRDRTQMLTIGLINRVPRPACPDCRPETETPLPRRGFPFLFVEPPDDDLGRWYRALPEEAVPVIHVNGDIEAHRPKEKA